jgi:hypothetical protein
MPAHQSIPWTRYDQSLNPEPPMNYREPLLVKIV